MASLESIILATREDIIVKRVLTISPSGLVDGLFTPHGDPQDFDDNGVLESAEGPARLFDVTLDSLSATTMRGSTTQDYDAKMDISVFYPKNIKGTMAAHIDAEAISCKLHANDSLPDGVQMYSLADEKSISELNDYAIMVISLTVSLTADI